MVVLEDSIRKKIPCRKFVRYETLADYKEGIDWLESHQFQKEGIVFDGLRGMFHLLFQYRVQMCQYHQVKIIKRYLTSQPELSVSKELLSIVKLLAHMDKESFIGLFEEWVNQWDSFLKERA